MTSDDRKKAGAPAGAPVNPRGPTRCWSVLVGLLLSIVSAREVGAQATDVPDTGENTDPPPAQTAPPAVDDGHGANTEGVTPSRQEPTDEPTGEPTGERAPTGAGLFEQGSGAGSDRTTDGSGVGADVGSGNAPPLPFTLNGYMRGDMFVGKVPGYRTAAMKAGYGELSLALRTAKERYGDGFAELRVRSGLQGDDQQTFVELREAYANTYLGPVDLRLGRQIIVWGRADALNPTNNLTPFDLRVRSPIEDDRRIGNFGARMFVKLAPVRLEGVWMPLYAASELPPVGLPEFVTYGAPRFPRPELKNGLLAGRIHLELAAFEMSFSYLHGNAPLPGLSLANLTLDPVSPEVRVSRTAYSQHVVGFDFSTALGDIMAIRAEAAYRRPVEYQTRIYAPHPDLQYVLGIDRTFGPVSLIAQYLGRYVFDWRRENGPDQVLDPSILMMMPSPFVTRAATDAINQQLARTNQILFLQTARVQHLATVRVDWLTAHDTLSLSTLALLNVTTREWLLSPKATYHISDALTASLGAEIFAGPDGTLFGLVDEILSAGYAELRFIF